MKRVEFIPGNNWYGDRLDLEDEHGNRGRVYFPRLRGVDTERPEWEDAEVVFNSTMDGLAKEVQIAAEFAIELGRIAAVLDAACEEDAASHKEREAHEEQERELNEKAYEMAERVRCDTLAQYYDQIVRVQRVGYSSTASGPLRVKVKHDESGQVANRMHVATPNGLWDFQATRVARFEVKNGSRFEPINLIPMEKLEETARKELQYEHAEQ